VTAAGLVPVLSVPVLMYHSTTERPTRATRGLSVRLAAFDHQLRHLRDHGFIGLTFGQLCAARRSGIELPPRPVVLTFDDGYADLHEQALPLLAEHGFPATVFVTTGWLRDAGPDAAGRPLDRMLSWSQLAELAAAGIEIGAHSHSHPQLDQLPEPAVRAELQRSRGLLQDRLSLEVPSLAYPFGYSSRRVREVAHEVGYRQAAAVANAAATAAGDPFAVPRLTVRRTTTEPDFHAVVAQRGLRRHYAVDHLLTGGYLLYRRARAAVRRAGAPTRRSDRLEP
jgi:peptidoglycan/xylan/chitin deacetylase (PgdA/CDA1 family)